MMEMYKFRHDGIQMVLEMYMGKKLADKAMEAISKEIEDLLATQKSEMVAKIQSKLPEKVLCPKCNKILDDDHMGYEESMICPNEDGRYIARSWWDLETNKYVDKVNDLIKSLEE